MTWIGKAVFESFEECRESGDCCGKEISVERLRGGQARNVRVRSF